MRIHVGVVIVGMALLLLGVSASADPLADRAVGLYEARRRFEEALAVADGRREDAQVRAAADDATAFALPFVGAAGTLGEAARALVRDAAGAPLGPWLRQTDTVREDLLAAWLREHADAAFEAEVMRRSPRVRVSFAQALVVRRPDLASGLLRSVVAETGTEHSSVCGVALALPGALRRAWASSALARAHRFRDAYCLALFATLPSQRRELVHAVLALPREGDEGLWALAGAVLALPMAPPSRVPALLSRIERSVLESPALASTERLAAVAPWIERAHPRVMAALSALEARRGRLLPPLLPLRVGRDDPLERLSSLAAEPQHLADDQDDTVTRLALALPHRPEEEDRAIELLVRARPRLTAYGGASARPRLDAWIDALTAVRACATEACLRDVVRGGSAEAATRALVVLGARSLATAPTARVVRWRMAMESVPGQLAVGTTTVFASVLLALAADCPAELRSIARSMTTLELRPYDPFAGWQAAFVARCNERTDRGAR